VRRFAPAAIAWAAAVTLAVIWLATRGSLELNAIQLGAGIRLSLRLDAIGFACSLATLVGGAGLLTLRPGERWTLLLALAAALLAINSDDLLFTAVAAGLALLFVLEASGGGEGATWPLWAAVLLAAWAGVSLQVVGGTAGFGAAPPAALNAGIAGLVLLAAIGLVGAVPTGESWPPVAWVTMPPIGGSLLLRVFTLGNGLLPHAALYTALALVGLLVWGLAAWRAAVAASGREFLLQSLPAMAGTTLLAAASGVQLGAVAVVFALYATVLFAVLVATVAPRRRADMVIAAAVVAGLPPGLGFVAWLLAIQAQLESDRALAWIVVPAALAWLLWMFAALRALSLQPAGATASRRLAHVLGAISVLLGLGAGLVSAAIAQPAAATAGLSGKGPRLAAGLAGMAPASGGWPALVLGGVLVLAVVAAAGAGSTRLPAFSEPMPPLLPNLPRPRLPWPAPGLPGLPAAEALLSGRRPLLWAALIMALAVFVTRAPL